MNKNTLIKILSVLVIFAVIISTVGCSIGNDGTVKDGEVGAIDTKELPTENGTAIYENTVVNEETGETETYTQIIDVDAADTPVMKNETIDKDKFVEENVKDDYGMSDEDAENVISKPENWRTFYVFKYIENKTDKTMITKSVSVDNNGEGSIFIRNKLDAEYGIGAGGISNIAIHAMVDMSKYPDDESLQEAFEKLNIKVEYTLTENRDADIDDWESVTTDTFEIN